MKIEKGFAHTNSSKRIKGALKDAVGSLEEFLQFLRAAAIPYPYRKVHFLYSAENERALNLSYYTYLVPILNISTLAAIDARNVIQIVTDRFRRWFTDEMYFAALQTLRANLYKFLYPSLRTMILYLIDSSQRGAFANATMILERYSLIDQVLLENAESEKNQIYAALYVQLCPILRALTLRDSPKHVQVYLKAFKRASCPQSMAANPDGFIHRVLDHMIADLKFIRRAKTNFKLGGAVMDALLSTFEWNHEKVLESAIKRNFLNLTEALLLYSRPFDSSKSSTLLTKSIYYLRETDSIEPILLVAAYCGSMSAVDFERFAGSIDSSEVNDAKLHFRCNIHVLGQRILMQAAALIRAFGTLALGRRSICAQVKNEQVPLPCPLIILDSLYPKLKEFRTNDAVVKNITFDAHDIYPHYSLLNLGQFLLFRMFGIPFAWTRIVEDGSETPEWREVIGYLNLMNERVAALYGESKPLVSFYDPIEESLRRLYLDDEEYALQYRERAIRYFSAIEEARKAFKYDLEEIIDDGFVVLDDNKN